GDGGGIRRRGVEVERRGRPLTVTPDGGGDQRSDDEPTSHGQLPGKPADDTSELAHALALRGRGDDGGDRVLGGGDGCTDAHARFRAGDGGAGDEALALLAAGGDVALADVIAQDRGGDPDRAAAVQLPGGLLRALAGDEGVAGLLLADGVAVLDGVGGAGLAQIAGVGLRVGRAGVGDRAAAGAAAAPAGGAAAAAGGAAGASAAAAGVLDRSVGPPAPGPAEPALTGTPGAVRAPVD